MPNVTLTTDVEIYCFECHKGLCNLTEVKVDVYGNHSFYIQPCPDCLEKAREEERHKIC